MQQGCPGNDHNDQLVFDSKQTAWIASAFLLALFFVFMVGYFLGKHQALDQFSHALDQESVADKIYSSLCASYEGKTSIEATPTDKSETSTLLPELESDEAELPVDRIDDRGISPDKVDQVDPKESITKYYALLIGFGSQKSAQQYVDRLSQHGLPVLLKKRSSTTAKGRVINWYQVVTNSFASRNELEKFIATLAKREHLNAIKIVTIE